MPEILNLKGKMDTDNLKVNFESVTQLRINEKWEKTHQKITGISRRADGKSEIRRNRIRRRETEKELHITTTKISHKSLWDTP